MSGFSVEPTVVARTWRWSLGGVLRSQTFKLASVLLIAGALTWNTLERMKTPAAWTRPRPRQPPAHRPTHRRTRSQQAPVDSTHPPSPRTVSAGTRDTCGRQRQARPPILTRRRRAILSADRREDRPTGRATVPPEKKADPPSATATAPPSARRQALRRQLLHSRQASPPPATSRRPKSRCRFGVILLRNQPPAARPSSTPAVEEKPAAANPPGAVANEASLRIAIEPTSARSPPAIAKP